jgi:hypothetical protein
MIPHRLLAVCLAAAIAMPAIVLAQRQASSPPPQLLITSATVSTDGSLLYVDGVNFRGTPK